MANVNQEIDTIRVGGVDYEVSDPHALYGEHDESAPDLTDNPLYESDLVTQVTNDSTKPSAANVPYALKQQIDQISSDLASVPNLIGTITAQSGETYAQVLNRVGAMIANTGRSLRGNSVIIEENRGYGTCYVRTSYGPNHNVFSLFVLGASTINMYSATVGTTGSQLKAIVNGTVSDLTNSAATAGETFTVYG